MTGVPLANFRLKKEVRFGILLETFGQKVSVGVIDSYD